MSPEDGRKVARRRIAEIAESLWLPRDATRAEVLAAIESLSDGARKNFLRRRVASITCEQLGER